MIRWDAAPEQPTEVLAPVDASALADPGAATEVLVRPADRSTSRGEPPVSPPAAPLLDRRTAAEAGVYVGAALILLAFLGAALRGWPGWDPTRRGIAVGLTATALLATGLFVRLPWRRRLGAQRRRAVSALLTSGLALAATGAALALDIGQGSVGGGRWLHAALVVLGMAAACAIARTPLSETGVLGALAWTIWVVVPAGQGTWLALVALGIVWALLGRRWARGRRKAVVAGVGVALIASVGLAQGPAAWAVRGVLLALAGVGLVRFLRGGGNAWLALGVAAATALSASVAGGALSPALALMVAGMTTMAVSGLALRSTRE